MRKVKRWRYFCDHCNKSGGSAFHIRNHEKGCTANPDRICGLCHHAGIEQKPMSDLLSLIGDRGNVSLEKLREATENCPACIFAAIRISGVNKYDPDPETGEPSDRYFPFDLKLEFKSFWDEHNSYE